MARRTVLSVRHAENVHYPDRKNKKTTYKPYDKIIMRLFTNFYTKLSTDVRPSDNSRRREKLLKTTS